MKMIAEEKIKEGTRIKCGNSNLFYDGFELRFENTREYLGLHDTAYGIATSDFEIIQDDIQAIKDFKSEQTMSELAFEFQEKINEIIHAIKQLNKRIGE